MIVQPSIKSLTTTIEYLLFILFCCLIAYWPLTFHVFSLKNDALNYFLPVRHQISEAIYNRKWPFWSPYFNLGYPLHGDMQSGVWNPFVQLLSLFGPYTLKTLQCETVLYIYLCGVGMFFLLSHFSIKKNIAIWASIAYMLCGFNSDSAQFLNWISGASFLPFVFLFYYRALNEASMKQGVFCGFFLYLLFVTAYPADFIITAYVLFFYLIVHLYQTRTFSKRKTISAIIATHFCIAASFLLLSLPAIISFYEFLHFSERGNGASYQEAMSSPLHPFLLFSYVTPLGVWRAPYVSYTDPLERNCYFGIITFLLLVAGIFMPTDNRVVRFCKWSFLITIIFSFGKMGGLRPLAYYVLPLMNAFRHPANAKLFTIFFACIIAAFTMQQIAIRKISGHYQKMAFYIVMGLLVSIFIYALVLNIPFFGYSTLHATPLTWVEKTKERLDHLSFSGLVGMNFFLQLPFMIIAYFTLVKKFKLKWLIIGGIANNILFTMLFQPFTVVKKDSVSSIQSLLNKITKAGYPLPDLKVSLKENSKEGEKYFKEIGALNMYNKKVGRIDYRITPSNLNTQNKFWQDGPLRNQLMSYPLLYRADTAFLFIPSIRTLHDKRIVTTDDPAIVNFINLHSKDNISEIHVLHFDPTQFEFEVNSERPGFCCLLQNYYPRWDLTVDGIKTRIYNCNVSFMGFKLDAGHHLISFKYKTSDLSRTFYISLICSFLIILLGIVQLIKPRFI